MIQWMPIGEVAKSDPYSPALPYMTHCDPMSQGGEFAPLDGDMSQVKGGEHWRISPCS